MNKGSLKSPFRAIWLWPDRHFCGCCYVVMTLEDLLLCEVEMQIRIVPKCSAADQCVGELITNYKVI